MKIKIFVIIFTIILFQNISFATELSNSKQIHDEQIFQQNIENAVTNVKSLPYRLLLLEDLYVSAIADDDTKSFGVDIIKLRTKYQNNKQSKNYIYSEKAYALYMELCDNVHYTTNPNSESMNLSSKKIIIPNSIYNSLDKNLVEIINMLNVIADNI